MNLPTGITKDTELSQQSKAVWNAAIENAARIAEITSSCPKDTAENIRSLKK